MSPCVGHHLFTGLTCIVYDQLSRMLHHKGTTVYTDNIDQVRYDMYLTDLIIYLKTEYQLVKEQ